MAKFNLSDSNDYSKGFLIKRSELLQRIDPIYYNSNIQKYLSGKYNSVKLSNVILKFKSGFGAGKQDQANGDEGIIQIRPTNIDSNGLLKFDKNIYLPYGTEAEMIDIDDVLFNNTNSQELVGKTTILKEKKRLFFSNHITKLVVDKSKLIPDFLWIILNLYQENKIFYSICTNWNNQSGVGLELLKSLKIPLPPKEIQQQIVEKINSAYTQKQQKEAQAKELLASIDTYLLNELGISLPEKDTSLQARINSNVRLKDVSGSRFDPMLYDKNTIALKEAIINIDENKFITKPLKYFVIKSVAGDWGLDENDKINGDEYEKCLVIRATEFDNDFNLKLDNSRVKYRLIKKDKLNKIEIQENDLLIEKSGGSIDQPVGRISILTKEILENNIICYSNFIHKIRVDNTKLNPQYLFSFLKTIHNIKLTEAMQSQTNGIRNLIMSTYLNQTIVLPIKSDGNFDIEKQIEIATHIQNIRAQAKQLQEEAKMVLEEAKREVEKVIIG